MENITEDIKNVPLFAGIAESQLPALLRELAAVRKTYKKGDTVFWPGEPARYVGIICFGNIQITKLDFTGSQIILASFTKGELFGEAFSCAGVQHLPVHIVSATDSGILLINYKKIMAASLTSSTFHHVLIKNMVGILAVKNVFLNQKNDILSKRSTRGKLIAYLSDFAQKTGSNAFTIPFDRQELADYLCVERSAMSAELSNMQADGLIRTNRSWFEVLAAENI